MCSEAQFLFTKKKNHRNWQREKKKFERCRGASLESFEFENPRAHSFFEENSSNVLFSPSLLLLVFLLFLVILKRFINVFRVCAGSAAKRLSTHTKHITTNGQNRSEKYAALTNSVTQRNGRSRSSLFFQLKKEIIILLGSIHTPPLSIG
jgi:hypothetical protein